MIELNLPLANSPIVEAVVDINVEMRPGFVLVEARERLAEEFADRYPLGKEREFSTHEIAVQPGAAGTVKSQSGLESLMFIQADEKQLLQVRRRGFSFNRLTPYEGFDRYQSEIEARWKQFCTVVEPVRVREIKMRFINRIEIPLEGGQVDLDQYLMVGPRAPDEDEFGFIAFSSRSVMFEKVSGTHVVLSLASREPLNNVLPVILDIEASVVCECDPLDLQAIAVRLATLRLTKNRVFRNSLEEKCLALFY